MAINKAGRYAAIDLFRLLAAVWVVFIHTTPLWSLSPFADFLLFRALGRLAVPFFFMASGFFLGKGPRRFTASTLRLYAIALLLYLPLALSSGSYSLTLAGLPRLLWALVWEGPFYHLWYFPASILGAWVAWGLYKALGRAGALAATSLLYLLALLGDSWSALFSASPFYANTLGRLYHLIGTTRNGLLFAPLFFLLGMLWHGRPAPNAPYRLLFPVSLALMLAEAAFLHSLGGLNWDAMFLLLPLTSWLLFGLLLQSRTKLQVPGARDISLWLYILHPWCIVVLHKLAGRFSPYENMMVENSLLFSLLTLLLSLLAAVGLTALLGLVKAVRTPEGRCTATIDLSALRHNLYEMQALLPPGASVMAVVKANAYGLGAVPVARTLRREGVNSFAVATLQEAIHLRLHGIRGQILILGYVSPACAGVLKLFHLTATAVDLSHAAALAAVPGRTLVQLKIDTGMHRLGIPHDAEAEVTALYQDPGLRITGIYTHFSHADSLAPGAMATTQQQANRFAALVAKLEAKGIETGTRHLQSSYGLLNHPGLPCDVVRLGISLYGTLSAPGETKLKPDLRPVLSLTARVASVRALQAGQPVGYSGTYVCEAPSRIATLSIGYADGLPRALHKGHVLLHGQTAPIVGRISMDSLAVDVTGIPETSAGGTATLIGTEGDQTITAETVATRCGTITNELLCRLGPRLDRVYTNK